jgi:hypothetical protein
VNHFWQNIHGCFSFAEFYAFIGNNAPMSWHGVEVGALYGQSAACLAIELRNREQHRTRLDLVELSANYDVIKSNLAPVSEVIGDIYSPMSSVDASRRYEDRSLNFVMLDGDHSYAGVRSDIDAWLPKLKSGGILATHDYAHYFPGLMRAWNESFREFHVMPCSEWPDESVTDARLPVVRADFQARSACGSDTDFLPVAWVRKA